MQSFDLTSSIRILDKQDIPLKDLLFVLKNQGYPLLEDENILSVGLGLRRNRKGFKAGKDDPEEVEIQFTVGKEFDSPERFQPEIGTEPTTFFIPHCFQFGEKRIRTHVFPLNYPHIRELLPKSSHGIPLASGPKTVVPLVTGNKIYNSLNQQGTIGPMFKETQKSVYVMTAGHLFSKEKEDVFAHPNQNRKVGLVDRFLTPASSKLDVALIRLSGAYKNSRDFVDIEHSQRPSLDERLTMQTASSTPQAPPIRGKVTRIFTLMKLQYPDGIKKVLGFEISSLSKSEGGNPNCELTKPGDSGALWYREKDNKKIPCGLHIAGEENPTAVEKAFACYTSDISERLTEAKKSSRRSVSTNQDKAFRVGSLPFPTPLQADYGSLAKLRPELREASDLVRAVEARLTYRVNGSGKEIGVMDLATAVNSPNKRSRGGTIEEKDTPIKDPCTGKTDPPPQPPPQRPGPGPNPPKAMVAFILDTGLSYKDTDEGREFLHDFQDRILKDFGQSFTSGSGPTSDFQDLNGHGTHVSGIVAANGQHVGIAPGAKLIPLKIHRDDAGNTFTGMIRALKWIYKNKEKIESTQDVRCVAISLSIGDGSFNVGRNSYRRSTIAKLIQSLKEEKKIAVVAAAGNSYQYRFPKQGICFPAILSDCISVGAVYDSDPSDEEISTHRKPKGQITKFSQRLFDHKTGTSLVDIFAPGSVITSTGPENGQYRNMEGTSQAAPIVTGAILMMQEYHLRKTGGNNLLEVDQIKKYLRESAKINRYLPLKGDRKDEKLSGFEIPILDIVAALGKI